MSNPKSIPYKDVNPGVDNLLILRDIDALPRRERDFHRIRFLHIGQRCKVVDGLAGWAKSSSIEYKGIMAKLRIIAKNNDLPKLSTIKRVGISKNIIQISIGNARLYCFNDNSGNLNVICTNTFWIGRGNKKTEQNKAIVEAEKLMNRWQNAIPVINCPDDQEIRVEKDGK